MLNQDKRITKATLKSFIKKNADNIYIKELSAHDGFYNKNDFHHVKFDGYNNINNTLGYQGLWLVHGVDNFYKFFDNDLYIGIMVSNCCGSSIVAILK